MRLRHLLCTGLIFIVSATSVHAQNVPPTIPVEDLLQEDGTLDLHEASGTIDLEGWRLEISPSGAPVFSKTMREAESGDEFWEDGFGNPLPSDRVNALVVDGSGNLYAGGRFTEAGGVPANHIAKWDGSNWNALGSGLGSGASVWVNALALDAGDNLYVGGHFTAAEGAPGDYIAKWDGTGWSALGAGTNDQVLSLAVDGTNLYAGGVFTVAGGISAGHVAKWDGSVWSAVGLGMNDNVWALAVISDSLYAGGEFTVADGFPAKYVAKWDGVAWIQVGLGMNNSVRALAVDGDSLYAGGTFTTAGGVSASSIAMWDGSSWSGLGSGTNNGAWTLAVDGSGNLYAGGPFWIAGGKVAFGVAKWDGSNWSAVGSGVNLQVRALALDGTGNPFAGGGPGSITSTQSVDIMVKWDGASWAPVGQGIGPGAGNGVLHKIYALAADGGDLYAGGSLAIPGISWGARIAKWDGSGWSGLGSSVNGDVWALAVDGAGNLYAGGEFTTADGLPANYVAKWDGSNWTALGLGMNDFVYALAIDGSGDLIAGGKFTLAGGPGMSANYVARWDGSAWSALGAGLDNTVRALAVDNGMLYAGGEFTMAGGAPAGYVAKWNGVAWSALGAGVNNTVRALAVDGSGSVYAGGEFTMAGGAPAGQVAKWTGASWNTLGSGLTGPSPSGVFALRFGGSGIVYAGGSFDSSGPLAVNNVAMWDGAAWSALGSGTNGDVFALDVGSLWVGGFFSTAGDKDSYSIAKWTAGERRIAVNVTVLLEGCYAGAGVMWSSLDDAVPDSQPFSGEPWFYSGSESVSLFPAEAVDWLLMELRADSTAGSAFARQAVFLLADGSVVDTSGISSPGFDAVSADSVYIVLRHRNHLDVMSPDKIEILADVASHDFTSSVAAAYTRGSPPMKDLPDGRFGLFAADADVDGSVLLLDFEAMIAETTAGASGYESGDFNLDGTVDALDFNLYLANAATGAESQVP